MLDNLEFASIVNEGAQWLEREFEEEGSVEQSLIMELMRPWGQTYFLWLFIFFRGFGLC